MKTRLTGVVRALGLGCGIGLAALSVCASAAGAAGAGHSTVPVTTVPVSLNFERPGLDQVGQLTFLGGVEIKSTDKHFGGLSSLLVSPDGKTMLAVSDHGSWVGATIVYDKGRLVGVRKLRIAPLLDQKGRRLSDLSKVEGDAEGLTEIPGSGLVVSFESTHRLWHYGATLSDAFDHKLPRPLPVPMYVMKTIANLPSNRGIESLTVLPNGALFAIAEGGLDKKTETLKAWYVGRRGVRMLAYRPHDNFRPTDLAALPDGDVLVLERRFTLLQGLGARIRRIKAAALQGGAPLEGEILATLVYPYNIDNMEGLAVRRDKKGHTILYLVSDDNFNPLERTLLLMFRLNEAVGPAPKPALLPGRIINIGD